MHKSALGLPVSNLNKIRILKSMQLPISIFIIFELNKYGIVAFFLNLRWKYVTFNIL